jgi:hypothetical protein
MFDGNAVGPQIARTGEPAIAKPRKKTHPETDSFALLHARISKHGRILDEKDRPLLGVKATSTSN